MTTQYANTPSTELVDELGYAQEQIAQWKTIEGEIKGELIERGDREVDGEDYGIKLVDVNRKNINWKLIADKLRPSRQLVTAHTRRQSFTAVNVYTLED